MAARKSYASDRRQSGGYSSARSKAGQAYMYGNVVAFLVFVFFLFCFFF